MCSSMVLVTMQLYRTEQDSPCRRAQKCVQCRFSNYYTNVSISMLLVCSFYTYHIIIMTSGILVCGAPDQLSSCLLSCNLGLQVEQIVPAMVSLQIVSPKNCRCLQKDRFCFNFSMPAVTVEAFTLHVHWLCSCNYFLLYCECYRCSICLFFLQLVEIMRYRYRFSSEHIDATFV